MTTLVKKTTVLSRAQWPKQPQMKINWWKVLGAISEGKTTCHEILELHPDSFSDCAYPCKSISSITQALIKRGVLVAHDRARGSNCATYSLTSLGHYCMARKDAGQALQGSNDNLKAPEPKELPLSSGSKMSEWMQFLTKKIIPTYLDVPCDYDYEANQLDWIL